MALGMTFPIAIALGWYLGGRVGAAFGRQAAGRLVGLALGIVSGFWELYKVAKRLEKYDGQGGPGDHGGQGGSGGQGYPGDPGSPGGQGNPGGQAGGEEKKEGGGADGAQ
jgi:hypothetical protein